MTINEYQYVDSYEKALAFFILKLEKTNNKYLKSLDVSGFGESDYLYYLKHYCNIGVKIDDFNLSVGFSIPFDHEYYLDQNGKFYDSIIVSNENLDLADIPNPTFGSIFSYVPLAPPPNQVDAIEKYIVWLAYQLEKGGSSISITHKTNPTYELKNFLIDTRNLDYFEKKVDFNSNPDYPSYDKSIDLGYINFNHTFTLKKDFLFRYGNFINAITPEINKDPNLKEETKTTGEIQSEISKTGIKFRIFKPLGIDADYGTGYKIQRSEKLGIYKSFADYALKADFNSTGGFFNTRWISRQEYSSTKNFSYYRFSGVYNKTKYNSTGGKLEARPDYETGYYVYNSNKKLGDIEYKVGYDIKKNYIVKNMIRRNR